MPHEAHAPDVTDAVMSRLGYARATDAADARRVRLRRRALRAAQAGVLLAACVLGVAWWSSTRPAPSQPPVADALRGSVSGGVEVLGSLRLGMPRAKDAAGVQSADATTPGTAAPAANAGSTGVRPF
jgi:hypothetical protein